MNILIENAESLEFLASDNQWTKIAAAAKCFGRTPATQQMINLEHGRGKGAPEVAAA
ncbi:MAG: hypothetical protein NTZ16_08705 [Verrucomicrobia bacterium]|nr:hypothetical protein [Verrucomicrobiota bacterium]